ncbi:DUF2975 domain-containing protein [Tenacibaculum crassostreae]|uniref:DUF2975 domain-containing protein n=1 Tax=Tenacibaculum crassostreae TaxID=502683 RepID=UPI0038B545AA
MIHHIVYGGSRIKVFKLEIPESFHDEYYHLLNFIALALVLYFIYLILEFRKVIFKFSKNSVFTQENSQRLRKVGRGLVIYGSIILCITIILGLAIDGSNSGINANSNPAFSIGYIFGYTIGASISKVLPIFVVALFVQFISFLVVKGNVLQEENDLTI